MLQPKKLIEVAIDENCPKACRDEAQQLIGKAFALNNDKGFIKAISLLFPTFTPMILQGLFDARNLFPLLAPNRDRKRIYPTGIAIRNVSINLQPIKKAEWLSWHNKVTEKAFPNLLKTAECRAL